ncbi:MAG: serine endopeptidase, partial [Haliea sp.]
MSSKGLRLSEKWFRRGLWLVAFVFAGFLIGLGGTIVGDLPRVEKHYTSDDFMDPALAGQARAELAAAETAQQVADTALEQARLQ